MINGVHHTNISTPNLDRAVAFYRDVLGFEVSTEASWAKGSPELDAVVGLEDSAVRFVILWAGNTHIELFEYSSPEALPRHEQWRVNSHGYTHICLDVTDLESEYLRLQSKGMRFTTPPVKCFGVLCTYGYDPDGNVIELQEILDWDALKLPPTAPKSTD